MQDQCFTGLLTFCELAGSSSMAVARTNLKQQFPWEHCQLCVPPLCSKLEDSTSACLQSVQSQAQYPWHGKTSIFTWSHGLGLPCKYPDALAHYAIFTSLLIGSPDSMHQSHCNPACQHKDSFDIGRQAAAAQRHEERKGSC